MASGDAADRMGAASAVDGTVAVCGASLDDPLATGASGSAVVFEYAAGAWSEAIKLIPASGNASDSFGGAVAVGGDIIAIGSGGDDDIGGADSGAAYVYTKITSTWTQQDKLKANDAAAGDFMGTATLNGDNGDNGAGSGAVYVYDWNGAAFDSVNKLIASDGIANDKFGWKVAVDGDNALIGADDASPLGAGSGASYLFQRVNGDWIEVAKLLGSDVAANDDFGASVGVSGRHAVAGSPFDDDNGNSAGAGFAFDLAFEPYGLGCVGSNGEIPDLTLSGDPRRSGQITIELRQGPAGATAWLFVGNATGFTLGPSGCNILVAGLFPGAGSMLLDGSGNVQVVLPIPPGAAPATYTLQAFVPDAGVPAQYAGTNGVSFDVP